jgi:hypothetical protein
MHQLPIAHSGTFHITTAPPIAHCLEAVHQHSTCLAARRSSITSRSSTYSAAFIVARSTLAPIIVGSLNIIGLGQQYRMLILFAGFILVH